MSMEDILKVLAASRPTGNAPRPQAQSADPMTQLIGSLLGGGGQAPSMPQGNAFNSPSMPQGGNGLGDMMGMLEMFMGGGNTSQSLGAVNDPIMAMLQPFVAQLAKKVNIPNGIAMMVVSYVVHKFLAHHPTSGRDSNSFDLDDVIRQVETGQLDNKFAKKSGMVDELSQKTGLDEDTTNQAILAAIELLGQQMLTK